MMWFIIVAVRLMTIVWLFLEMMFRFSVIATVLFEMVLWFMMFRLFVILWFVRMIFRFYVVVFMMWWWFVMIVVMMTWLIFAMRWIKRFMLLIVRFMLIMIWLMLLIMRFMLIMIWFMLLVRWRIVERRWRLAIFFWFWNWCGWHNCQQWHENYLRFGNKNKTNIVTMR